ncbi:hypothetical protein TYRP_015689 [Tyrophagus putrescentiae]|nr:hypothetical protein TYRP_015689 [Tyrophagus putrescentiae]
MYIFAVSSLLFLLHLSPLVTCQPDHPGFLNAAASSRSFIFPSSSSSSPSSPSALHSSPAESGNPFLSPFSVAPYSDRRDGLLVSSALANSLFSPHAAAAYADETPAFPMAPPMMPMPLMGPRSGPFSSLAPVAPFGGVPPMAPFMGAPGVGPSAAAADPSFLYGAPGVGGGFPPVLPSLLSLFSPTESAPGFNPYMSYAPSYSALSSLLPLLSYLPRMASPFGGLMGGPMGGGPMGGGPMGGNGRNDGRADGRNDGWPNGRNDGRTDGRNDGSRLRIEIGQKLSNSIYANSDNLRYDLSSFKDSSYSPSSSSSSPSSSSSSSSSTRYPSSYSSQTNSLQSQPGSSSSYSSSSPHSSSPSSSYQSDYALASNGYRQYLNQQQNLLSNPTLYNRISQYMPYMAPAMSSASGRF